MYELNKVYLIGIRLAEYKGENTTHYIFKSRNQELLVSKANTLSVKRAFKYITL